MTGPVSDAKSSHVLLVAKAFPPNLGGVETYSQQVSLAYARQGHRVTVLTQFHGLRGVASRVIDGLQMEVINVGYGPQMLVFLRMVFRLLALRSTGFDFIHATTWRVALPVLLCRPEAVIVTIHGREVMQTEGLLLFIMRWVFRRVSRIGVISSFSRNLCAEKVPDLFARSVVAWNGLSWPAAAMSCNRTRHPAPIRVLTACQLTVRKNVTGLVEAVSLLVNGRGVTDFHLKIAGDGPERAHIEDLIRRKGLAGYIDVLGTVDREDLPDLYRWADLFVHPQTHSHDYRDFESFCIAVADAMGFGLAVIAGRDGAPEEYIEHGENGWLVDGADHDAIADLLLIAGQSPELRSSVGARAQRYAQTRFSWDRHVHLIASDFVAENQSCTS